MPRAKTTEIETTATTTAEAAAVAPEIATAEVTEVTEAAETPAGKKKKTKTNEAESNVSGDEVSEMTETEDSESSEGTETAEAMDIAGASDSSKGVTEEAAKKPKKKTKEKSGTRGSVEGLFDDDIFDKRRVHKATNEEKKDLYEEEDIFVDVEDSLVSEKTKRKAEYNLLRDAARSVPRTILIGEIESVFETDNGYMMASVGKIHRMGKKNEHEETEGLFQVLIPASQMLVFNQADLDDKDKRAVIRNKLTRRIGTEICFCVYDVREKEGIAAASRLTAQMMRVNHYYVYEAEDNMPRIFPGMLAQATIIEIHNSYIYVEVGGAEGKINVTDLSYNHLGPLFNEFKVGEKIKVKIKGIKFFDHTVGSQTYRLATVECSAKEAAKRPQEKYFSQFKEKQVCGGVVKMDSNEIGVFVTLMGKMDCLCPIPAGRAVKVGQKCSVLITKMDQEKKLIYGEILNY